SLPRRPLRRAVFDRVPKKWVPVWAYRAALSAGCSDLGRRRPRDSESDGHSHRPAWTRPVALDIQTTRESSPAAGGEVERANLPPDLTPEDTCTTRQCAAHRTHVDVAPEIIDLQGKALERVDHAHSNLDALRSDLHALAPPEHSYASDAVRPPIEHHAPR